MNGLQSRYVPVMGTLNFLGLWCRRPLSIGAVVPSSLGLAAAIAREVDFPGPGVVVELGGGTGSVTRELLRTVPRPNDIVVVERERSLCSLIAARCPGVRVVCGDARNLQALLAEAGVERIKAIASSLPLLSIAGEARDEIIRQSFATLAPDGVLVQFTYGPRPPVRRATATAAGFSGRRTAFIARNLPPASLWCYRRVSASCPEAAPASVRTPSPGPRRPRGGEQTTGITPCAAGRRPGRSKGW